MSRKIEDTAFVHYYIPLLKKDTLTDQEFRRLVTDWLLGMNYYIVDPVSGPQGSRIILDEIMKRFPKSKAMDKADKEYILRTSFVEMSKEN